jgi:hypothetical protein
VKPGQRGESPSRTQRPVSQKDIRPSPLPYKPRHCSLYRFDRKILGVSIEFGPRLGYTSHIRTDEPIA